MGRDAAGAGRRYILGMAAVVAVLLTLLPFAAYMAWRRYGPSSGEPSSGAIVALLLGVGLMLGVAAWWGLSRSAERGMVYIPAHVGPDGEIIPGRSERPR
jgi:hypothetical protein